MNKHVIMKMSNKKRKGKKYLLDNYGILRNFSIEEGKNFFLLYYKGEKRARFYHPITIEMIKKYALAYDKRIKELNLKL